MVLVFVLNQIAAMLPRLTSWAAYPLATVVTLVASWLIVAVAQRVPLLRVVLPM
ncbi:MAG: hypothetical protein CPDRYMAC_4364 [uncultured Paraburkholderia sp.]|nr:MAG: hypothetical protein CPDRYDRY_4262 [uncultured Paraburkholderia sp.]CAH2936307.1 MAG: hypothetical protein CPDRYMAC_4364 [uncultured Paraburkholderia sp.]